MLAICLHMTCLWSIYHECPQNLSCCLFIFIIPSISTSIQPSCSKPIRSWLRTMKIAVALSLLIAVASAEWLGVDKCSTLGPSCSGGWIEQTGVDCPCPEQKGRCDRWRCPWVEWTRRKYVSGALLVVWLDGRLTWNPQMYCGQERTGCVRSYYKGINRQTHRKWYRDAFFGCRQ